jgi:6,7-dimethyl-8-ribityllumazine synthase
MSTRVAIVAAAFNEPVVGVMISEAQAEVVRRGGEVVKTVRVPGAYEIPLTADLLLRDLEIDLLVVLGFIEKGETLHGEVMGQVVHRALLELQLLTRKPIGLGIIGPGATPEQAELRKEPYARAAVAAAFAHAEVLEELAREKRMTGFGG